MSYIGNTSTQQSYSPSVDYFSGNGSTTAFTLSRPAASVADVQVTIDNVAQNPSSAYTVSGSTITFTSAPLSGTNNIYVRYTSLVTQSIAPGQGTVTTTSFVSSTGTGAGVFQTSPTITTPVISSLSSASATALTLQSAGTTAITVDTSQNVGIGTTNADFGSFGAGERILGVSNPTSGTRARLSLQNLSTGTSGVAGTIAFFNASTQLGSLDVTADGATNKGYYVFNTNNGTSNSERMRIGSDGRVSINGSAIDSSWLSITGNVSNPTLQSYQNTTSSVSHLWFRNTNGVVGSVTTSGSLTSYNVSSDYRLKENITSLTGALAKITQLKPSVYNYKADPKTSIQGFIAHELQAVIPHAVTGDKDATREEEYEVTPAVKDQQGNITTPAVTGTRTVPVYQGVDASFLIPYLTAAIQELSAKNDALTARIVALEAK